MTHQTSEELERVRQQFNHSPYPRIPLETSPKQDYNLLYVHNLVTPYYLRHQKVVGTEGRLILDAGCGTGYKSLILAEANPGAKIVGIDISEASIDLARQRLKHHGFEDNTEFHVLSIEDLPQLGLMFDYINCDEVLYLLPDPIAGMQAMQSVLKPDGLIRSNLHNALQRAVYYRAQALFSMMGLMENPQDLEVEIVIETMKALKPSVNLKERGWEPLYERPEGVADLFANHMLVGDKGFTIPDLFAILRASHLDLVRMVNWRHWDVTDLFKDAENLPAVWGMSLAEATVEERLRLYELLNPIHRLMDFWCAHPQPEASVTPIDDWQDADWQGATVHLHPQLRTETVHKFLTHCVADARPFEISQFINIPVLGSVMLDSTRAACLLPLWEQPQPFVALVEHYRKLRPLNLVTLEPISQETAFEDIKQFFNRLDAFLYVLIEKSA
jgi:2-polyprenyl-3-methyl-5-hydroxy-6-metoxy-1,4-benzoquinol methylase